MFFPFKAADKIASLKHLSTPYCPLLSANLNLCYINEDEREIKSHLSQMDEYMGSKIAL